MASDWVKMRGVLLKHQKTARMARFLAEREDFREWMFITPPDQPTLKIVPREVIIRIVVSGLLSLWDTANATISEDDLLSHTEVDDLDLMAGIPGFGDAICDAGWAEEVTKSDVTRVTGTVTPSVTPNVTRGIRLPNFIEFNTPDRDRKPAKSGAERQSEYRERRKSNKSDERVTKSVTKSDGLSDDEVTKSDADREIDREIDTTPTPPTPSPQKPVAVAVAGKDLNSGKAGEGEPNLEVAAFAEWRKLEVELRNLGMVATDEPIQNLQVQGLTPADGWEIIAYWKSKPWDYWPEKVKALRSKLVRAIEGEAVDSAWLQPSDRYLQAAKADRGEEERRRRIREAEKAEAERSSRPTPQAGKKSAAEISAELEPVYGPILDAMPIEERDALAIPIYGDPGSFHFQIYQKNWRKPGDRIRRVLMQEIAKRSSADV